MFNGGVAPMRALAAEPADDAGGVTFSVALTEYELRDFSLVDVNAAGCSKGTTLALGGGRRVPALGGHGGRRQFERSRMLEFAGTAVVMGNAVPALRAAGFPLTGTTTKTGWPTRSSLRHRSRLQRLEAGAWMHVSSARAPASRRLPALPALPALPWRKNSCSPRCQGRNP